MAKVRLYQEKPASVSKDPARGRWQTSIRYQEADAEEARGRSYGDPALGPKRQTRHLLKERCYPKGNRGRERALAEAREWQARLIAESVATLEREPEGHPAGTVGECVSHYLEVLRMAGDLERSTLGRYEDRAAVVLDTATADIMVADLTMQDVEALRNGLRRRYAATTTRDIVVLLKASLDRAVTEGLIPSSPAAKVTVPVPKGSEPAYLPDADCGRLVEDLRSRTGGRRTPAPLATLMALLTGMREEEICGLRYRDVDADEGVIRVRRVVGRCRDGSAGDAHRRDAYYLKGPKSASSRRDIPMSAETRAIVDECRDAATASGDPVDGDCFVFGRGRDFMKPRALYRNFTRRAERLGIRDSKGNRPTFHALRHTFATRAIRDGVDVRSVASILGHSDVGVTLNFYASSDPAACRRAMEAVAAGFGERPGDAA